MVIRPDGIIDWNLRSAAEELGLSCKDLINLGKEGKLRLSIRVPSGYQVWLLNIVPQASLNRYKKNCIARNTYVFPEKVEATHLNLSIKDCAIVGSSELKQGVFNNVYRQGHFSISNEYEYIQLMEGEKKYFEKGIYFNFTRYLRNPYKPDLSIVNLNSYFKVSIIEGVYFMRAPAVERKFALFNEKEDQPLYGKDWERLSFLEIEQDDVYVTDIELQGYQNMKFTYIEQFVGIEEGEWTSDILALLNKASLKINRYGMGNPGLDDETRKNILDFIKSNGLPQQDESSASYKIFCKIVQHDGGYVSKKTLNKIKKRTIEKGLEIHPRTPVILLVINKVAKDFWAVNKMREADNKDAHNKKTIINMLRDYDFPENLATHSATCIVMR